MIKKEINHPMNLFFEFRYFDTLYFIVKRIFLSLINLFLSLTISIIIIILSTARNVYIFHRKLFNFHREYFITNNNIIKIKS